MTDKIPAGVTFLGAAIPLRAVDNNVKPATKEKKLFDMGNAAKYVIVGVAVWFIYTKFIK